MNSFFTLKPTKVGISTLLSQFPCVFLSKVDPTLYSLIPVTPSCRFASVSCSFSFHYLPSFLISCLTPVLSSCSSSQSNLSNIHQYALTVSTPSPPPTLVSCCLVTKLHETLCDPMDCILPGSSVHRLPRQEYLSGLPSFSRGSSQCRDWTHILCLGGQIVSCRATREASLVCSPPPKRLSAFTCFSVSVSAADMRDLILSWSARVKTKTLIRS